MGRKIMYLNRTQLVWLLNIIGGRNSYEKGNLGRNSFAANYSHTEIPTRNEKIFKYRRPTNLLGSLFNNYGFG